MSIVISSPPGRGLLARVRLAEQPEGLPRDRAADLRIAEEVRFPREAQIHAVGHGAHGLRDPPRAGVHEDLEPGVPITLPGSSRLLQGLRVAPGLDEAANELLLECRGVPPRRENLLAVRDQDRGSDIVLPLVLAEVRLPPVEATASRGLLAVCIEKVLEPAGVAIGAVETRQLIEGVLERRQGVESREPLFSPVEGEHELFADGAPLLWVVVHVGGGETLLEGTARGRQVLPLHGREALVVEEPGVIGCVPRVLDDERLEVIEAPRLI